MATMMWCIYCEDMVLESDGFHISYDSRYGDFFGCTGPFFTSAPQDLPDNWQDELVEPSEEEMDEMDRGSELLLWDLGLMEK